MQINLIKRLKYGKAYYFPDCAKSEIICKLMNRTCIPKNSFLDITLLGFNIMVSNIDGKNSEYYSTEGQCFIGNIEFVNTEEKHEAPSDNQISE